MSKDIDYNELSLKLAEISRIRRSYQLTYVSSINGEIIVIIDEYVKKNDEILTNILISVSKRINSVKHLRDKQLICQTIDSLNTLINSSKIFKLASIDPYYL